MKGGRETKKKREGEREKQAKQEGGKEIIEFRTEMSYLGPRKAGDIGSRQQIMIMVTEQVHFLSIIRLSS